VIVVNGQPTRFAMSIEQSLHATADSAAITLGGQQPVVLADNERALKFSLASHAIARLTLDALSVIVVLVVAKLPLLL
jgi:hypothetical protein